jgi:hypothetical protein
MQQPPRGVQFSRRGWLLAGLGTALCSARAGGSLAVTYDGDNLHIADPGLHFLNGKPLERLKDGASVLYLAELAVFSDRGLTVLRRSPVARFVVSYDIWREDKYSITARGPVYGSAANLSAAAAESWCLENIAVSVTGIAPDQTFWLRLEMRTGDPRDLSRILNDSGLSLRSLVLLLGRKPGPDDPQWTREAGPLRLADLVRTRGRGTRTG